MVACEHVSGRGWRDGVRRRAQVKGVAGLGDGELVEILVGPLPGDAGGESLLRSVGGLPGLVDCSTEDITSACGVGEARALRVLAAMEIGRRAACAAAETGEPIRSSADVHARLACALAPLAHEVFVALGLDARGRVIGEHRISEGGLEECPVVPRTVFLPLTRSRAVRCILAHNHPSGDPILSAQDWMLTLRMVECGRVLCIGVLDHVIVASGGFYSFRDEGLI